MTRERSDHAQLVESWLKEPVWLPESDVGRIGQLVRQTPQQGARLRAIDIGRLQPMLSTTQLVAGGLVVALFSGLLLNGVLPTGSGVRMAPAAAGATVAPTAFSEVLPAVEMAAMTPTIALPDELPEGARSGTIDTAAGPVTWVHLSGPAIGPGDGGMLPRMQALVPWDGGVAAWFAFMGHSALTSSIDGVTWQREEVPANGMLGVVDGTAYLVSPESRQVWARDIDAGSWQELDATAISESMPGAGWESHVSVLAGPRALNDRVTFELSETYTLPRARLGIPVLGRTKKLKRLTSRRYALCGGGRCPDGGRKARLQVRFDQADDGLLVTNDRTGEVLGLIAGARLRDLYEGQTGTYRAGFAIEGSTVVPFDFGGYSSAGNEPSVSPPADTVPIDGAGSWLWQDEPSDADGSTSWMLVGDEWVSLDPLGLEEAGAWHASRAGDVAMVTTDPLGGEVDIWLLLLPEGA